MNFLKTIPLQLTFWKIPVYIENKIWYLLICVMLSYSSLFILFPLVFLKETGIIIAILPIRKQKVADVR